MSSSPNTQIHTSTSETEDDAPSTTTTYIEPTSIHTHTLVFLHGREDFGSDLAQSFFLSKDSHGRSLADIFPSIKWVFPTAVLRYSAQRDCEFSKSSFAEALNGEEVISQWFDVWDLQSPDAKKDLMLPGLRESIAQIGEIVREEVELVGKEKVVLGGISQGCATAVLALLAGSLEVAACVGWCSWLPFWKEIEELAGQNRDDILKGVRSILHMQTDDPEDDSTSSSPNRSDTNLTTTPATLTAQSPFSTSTAPPTLPTVFLAHAKDDQTVPFAFGQDLRATLTHLNFNVTWKEYETGGHWIQPEHGVDDMAAFLHHIFSRRKQDGGWFGGGRMLLDI